MKKTNKTEIDPDIPMEFVAPSDKELMDPESPFFMSDWYQVLDIPDSDPWYDIVGEFIDMQFFARRLKGKGEIESKSVIYTREFKSKAQRDILNVQGSNFLGLLGIIEQKISAKKVDVDFLQYWGELQRSYIKLQIAYPQFLREQKSGAAGKKNNKSLQYQWYALWYLQRGKLSRTLLNQQLEKLYRNIDTGKVRPPKGWTKLSLKKFMQKMSNPKKKGFKISSGFAPSNFRKPLMKAAAETGKGNKALPPVGIEFYK